MIETATVARTFPTRLETLASLGHGKLKNACPVEDKWVVRKLPAQFFKESLKRRESTAGAPLRVSPSILLNLWVWTKTFFDQGWVWLGQLSVGWHDMKNPFCPWIHPYVRTSWHSKKRSPHMVFTGEHCINHLSMQLVKNTIWSGLNFTPKYPVWVGTGFEKVTFLLGEDRKSSEQP